MSKVPRRELADAIKNAVGRTYRKRKFAVSYELQLNSRREAKVLRADVFTMTAKKEVVIVEVKTCRADYKADKKLLGYLGYCNKLYIACPDALAQELKTEVDKRIGLISYPSMSIIKPARAQMLDPEVLDKLLIRLVFRKSDLSRRKNS